MVANSLPIANLVDLRGKRVRITYTAGGLGRPQLQYKERSKSYLFSGNQIRSQDTEIGRLVTVTLGGGPETERTTLTLLLPATPPGESEAQFETNAIVTTDRTRAPGAEYSHGALQSYRVVPLRGRARLVQF